MAKAWLPTLCLCGLLCGDALAQEETFDPFRQREGVAGQAGAANVIASVEFVDTPISTVFRMVSDLTGWTIIMSPSVSQKPPRINLWIKNQPPEEVLQRITKLAGLVLERRGDTFEVLTFSEYARIYGLEQRVLQLKHAAAKDVVEIMKPFVEKEDQARILADEAGNRIALLVPLPLMATLEGLAKALDVPFESDVVQVIQLQHVEAAYVGPLIEEFVTQSVGPGTGRSRLGPAAGKTAAAAKGVEVGRAGESWIVDFMIEPKLNVIVLRGLGTDVARVAELITQLDVPQDTRVVSEQLKYTNVKDVFDTLKEILKGDEALETSRGAPTTRVKLAMSEPNSRIIISGSAQDVERITGIIRTIDQPLPPGTGGIRVYRLENVSCEEVYEVISALIEQWREREKFAKEAPAASQGIRRYGQVSAALGKSATKAPEKAPPAGEQTERPQTPGDVTDAQVTQAPEINALVIKASAAEHEEFASVIEEMDKQRGQVIIEVTIVSVENTEEFQLGIEMAGAQVGRTRTQTMAFTTFGIGAADPATGALGLADPLELGLNFGIFNSDDFQLVLNALETVGETRITSSPKILVEDNAPAQIKRLREEPFEVSSQGEATTDRTLGGFVVAGVVMTVIPHLSMQNWLRLEYDIEFSSFGERISDALPPPKLTNTANGSVRIPAGHTVVLGGLVSSRKGQGESAVPLLSDVPLLGELFKSRSNSQLNETLYIFIRPTVLRDPDFRDLLFVSRDDLERANMVQDEYPGNALRMLVPSVSLGERQAAE